jgi:hypothetical protein
LNRERAHGSRFPRERCKFASFAGRPADPFAIGAARRKGVRLRRVESKKPRARYAGAGSKLAYENVLCDRSVTSPGFPC